MPDQKLSQLTTATPATGDLLYMVDVSDTTDGPAGSSRKTTVADVLALAAPLSATYVTLSTNATLTNERVLTAGSGISITDGGAGAAVTIAAAVVSVNGQTGTVVLDAADVGAAPTSHTHDSSEISYTPTTQSVEDALSDTIAELANKSNIGHTHVVGDVSGAVPTSRTLTAGTGLTGGGDLSTDRSFAVSFGTTSTTACVGNDSRLSDSRTPSGSAGGDLTGAYPNPTIANNAVTLAKLADIATARILGRATAGSGDPEELTGAQVREVSGFVAHTTLATSGSVTIDTATNTSFILSLTNNVTLAVSNDQDGSRFTLRVRGQSSGYTVTWWSGIKWSGGVAPTIPTVSGRHLPIGFTRLASGEWEGLIGQECY